MTLLLCGHLYNNSLSCSGNVWVMVVLLRNAVSKQKSSSELSQSFLILLQGNSSEINAPVIVFYFRQLVLMSMSTLFCKVFVLML